MTTDADDALIAKLLAEDQAYNYHSTLDGLTSDGSEDDRPTRRKKYKKRGESRIRGPASNGGKDTRVDVVARPVDITVTGRRKRKDHGAAREAGKTWSDDEERLFLEALNLHGRNWKAAAAHVSTRDARQIASHAQKFFIKLAMTGQLLPSKVAESGCGYTLSGKLLDPESAAAKAYGFREGMLQALRERDSPSLAGIRQPSQEGDAGKESGCSAASNSMAAPTVHHDTGAVEVHPGKCESQRSKAQESQQRKRLKPEQPLKAAAEATEYAKSRPRRERQGSRMALGHTSESLELLACEDFVGPPGSGAPQAQPFSVTVHPQATVLMDLHAHLSSAEVIGLLGGVWQAGARRVEVVRAFPCRRAPGSQSGTSVELDPSAEVETRALMQAEDLSPVGWYHSHPVFAPQPSQKDCENQRNYQVLFRCGETGLEPFLGVIIGPYHLQLPTPASQVMWFMVGSRRGALQPHNVRIEESARTGGPEEAEMEGWREVVDMVAADITRVDLAQAWRTCTTIASGSQEGPPLSRAEKLQASLSIRLLQQQQHSGNTIRSSGGNIKEALQELEGHIQSSWGVCLRPRDADHLKLEGDQMCEQPTDARLPAAYGEEPQP